MLHTYIYCSMMLHITLTEISVMSIVCSLVISTLNIQQKHFAWSGAGTKNVLKPDRSNVVPAGTVPVPVPVLSLVIFSEYTYKLTNHIRYFSAKICGNYLPFQVWPVMYYFPTKIQHNKHLFQSSAIHVKFPMFDVPIFR